MKNIKESEYRIEQFVLDVDNFEEFSDTLLSAFLEDAAAQIDGATVAFTSETFKMMYGAPSIDKNLFVRAIYIPTNEVVGFVGAIPRKLKVEDNTYKFAIPSWLCVHSKHQRKGLASAMGKKLFEIGKEADYDGGFSLFEPEQHGMDISQIVSKEVGIPTKRVVKTKKFVVRVFDAEKTANVVKVKWYEKLAFKYLERVKQVKNASVRKAEPRDSEKLYELLMEHVERNQLSIIPEKDDFLWLLKQPIVNCVVHEDENKLINGFMIAWEFNLAGFGNIYPYGWLDTIHIHRLNKKEAKDLANYLSWTSKERGWAGLQTPYIPYFDSKPLQRAKYVFFPKTLMLDMMLLKDIYIPNEVESFYFDWR